MLENNKQRDFKHGKIYCIRNTITDDLYVGSTTQALCKRMTYHRYSAKYKNYMNMKLYLKINELGIDNFYIELIEDYPCDSLEQLRKREGYHIRSMATLNHRIAGRTDKEYYENNKDKLNDQKKEHYKQNKDKILEHQKEYREQNKNKINERHKEYYEQNKDKISERQKEYYNNNIQYFKEYYENNKQHFKEYYQNNKKEKQIEGEGV